MTKEIIIYGGGGHAKVVSECVLDQNYKIIGFMDDDPAAKLFNFRHLGNYQADQFTVHSMVIAIGSNRTRKKISKIIHSSYSTIVHSSSLVSPSAQLGDGSVLLHRSIVQAESRLGKHVILNTAAQVDHDCVLEDFVHIGPGAVLCGAVTIGEGTLVGAGAVILPGVSIGDWSIIGAGAVVTRNVPERSQAMGVPAIFNSVDSR